jgi:Tol biopolymer transport system component
VIRKLFRLMVYVIFLIAILAGCAKTTQIVPLPLPPTDTQVPATKTLPPPTDTSTLPTQTLEPSPTTSSIIEMPVTELVSVSSEGIQGNAESDTPAISADGRYVVFTSNASNLVEGDTNGESDIFVHDRKTGETTRVSVASNGTQANNWSAESYCMGGCSVLSISAGGRYVTFNSAATNLVGGDTDKGPKIFVHDRVTGETIRIPVVSDEPQEAEMSWGSSISADGRYVAFESWFPMDIFLYDRVTGETTRVSVSSDGMQGNPGSKSPSISIDGRYVAFHSGADNLVKGDTNNNCVIGELIYDVNCSDVFVHDRNTGETIRVSISSDGTQANSGSDTPVISVDGRFVTFTSIASNLVEGDTNGFSDIFVHNRVTGETIRVSVASDGTQGNEHSFWSSISADGRYVAFYSSANNLVEGDTNGTYDIFVRDLGASK